MRRLLAVAALLIALVAPVAAFTPTASATSPQACKINYIDKTIYCFQIVGPPGNFIDFFHGSLHNTSPVCVNTIMVAVRGPFRLWSRIYVVQPGQFMYWYFNVYQREPPGLYTATFWDISWGTIYRISWWVT